MVDAETLISSLKPVSEKLNKESDSATQILIDFEKQLNELNLGIAARVIEDGKNAALDIETENDEIFEFGYDRSYSGWCLVVSERRELPDGGFEYSKDIPILEASRTIRLSAIPYLPKLAEALKARAESTLENIKEAKEALKKQ